ncbi:MAG: TonB-dependent receptor [Saprospiraceae bacterium]
MNRFYIMVIILGSYIQSFSQMVTIQNSITGEPVEMVMVTSPTSDVIKFSNQDGKVNITSFMNVIEFEFYVLGYKSEVVQLTQIKESNYIVTLLPTGISLDQLVVSATRWNQKSRDVPSKVASISSKESALQNPQNAADLLAISGKIFIQKSQQGGGSPMIRGFATNRLLYSIDGVRMNTAIFRAGNIQNVISLDPFAIEHTEIFFGPGSIIYGSDAIGGVMSFQTLEPKLSLEQKSMISGSVVSRFSSANKEKANHFDIKIGFKKWALVTSVSHHDYGDLTMGSFGPKEYLRDVYVKRVNDEDIIIENENPKVQTPSGYQQINIMQKIRFVPSEKWDIQYGFHYSKTTEYARYDRHLRTKNGIPRYGEWDYGPQSWMMNLLQASYESSHKWFNMVSARLAHQSFGESRIERNLNAPIRLIREEKVDAYSFNLDFTKKLSAKNTLFYGLEAVLNEVYSTGIDENILTQTKVLGPARYPNSIWYSSGIYLLEQLKLSNQTTLQLGARYSIFGLNAVFDTTFYALPYDRADLSNGSLTGSAGIVFRSKNHWVLSAQIASAFRSPNVDDMGKIFDSEPDAVTIPNPDLEAEYAYNGEIGVAKLFGNNLKMDVSFYYTHLLDALVRRDYLLNGQDSITYNGETRKIQSIQNAAVAKVYGIQLGLEWKISNHLSFIQDLNFQRGEEELDDGSKSPSRHAPPWFGQSRLSYRKNKLEMQLYATYSGERTFANLPIEEQGKIEIYAIDSEGKPWSPGWYSVHYKILYSFNKFWTITSGVENITDQRYRPYSSGIVAPGRNFIVSVKLKW